MAEKTSLANSKINVQRCPRVEKAISILGKRWTGLIIWALLEGSLRFNELLKICNPVSDRVLTERLRELEMEGLVERSVFTDTIIRVEYTLTPKGRSMHKVIEALEEWAGAWVDV